MRRSLSDLPKGFAKKDNYPGLPEELKEFNYYLEDGGHCIMAIPECLLKNERFGSDLDMKECAVPVKYIIEKGYRMYEGHVVCDIPYDKYGLVFSAEYEEW